MGIRGSISTMGLPDVFQWLKLGAKTGVLLVDRQARSTQVFFQKGAIADLREPDQVPVMLSFLARAGYPVPEVRREAEFGEVLPLVAKRMAPTRADGTLQQALLLLEEPIREFFVHRLLDLFGWEFGEFSFRDNQSSGRPLLNKPVELEPLMLEWADRTLELQPIRAIIPDSPLVTIQARPGADSVVVSELERWILKLCRSSVSLLELFVQSGLTEFETLRLLYRLVSAALVSVVGGGVDARAQQQPPAPTGASNGSSQRLAHLTLWNQKPSVAGPDGSLVEETFRRLRTELAGRSELTGLGPDAVPRMLLRYDSPELMHLKLSQDEGFLLSRIDGSTPLRQLSGLTGLSRDATAGLILSLIVRGVLDAQSTKGIVDAHSVDRAESLLQQTLNPLSPKGNGDRATPSIDIDWQDAAEAESARTASVQAAPAAVPPPVAPVPITPSPAVWAPAAVGASPATAIRGPQSIPTATPPAAMPASPGPRTMQPAPAAASLPSPAQEDTDSEILGPRIASAPEPPFGSSMSVPAGPEPAATGAVGGGASIGSAQATNPRELAALYAKLGMRALKEQQYPRAIGLFIEALAQEESNSACWAALAQAYLMEGSNLEEAERCCRHALEGNDWNSRLHLLLGYILRSREQLEQAAQAFLRALELDHTNPQVHEALRSISLR